MIALSSPLESNDHGDKDGATEDNGVEGVEDLGEEESIELSRVRDRPVEDSSNAVVKKTEDEENIVEAGEGNEQVVEGALHIIGEKDVNRKGVAKKSKDSNRNLNMKNNHHTPFHTLLSHLLAVATNCGGTLLVKDF